MSLNNRLKQISSIKNNYVIQEVEDELLLVPVKENIVDFNFFITLNEVGAVIWDNIDDETDIDSLTETVLESFESDREKVKSDIIDFIHELDKAIFD